MHLVMSDASYDATYIHLGRMCPKSQKYEQNHKNTSVIRALFLKCSYKCQYSLYVYSYEACELLHICSVGDDSMFHFHFWATLAVLGYSCCFGLFWLFWAVLGYSYSGCFGLFWPFWAALVVFGYFGLI